MATLENVRLSKTTVRRGDTVRILATVRDADPISTGDLLGLALIASSDQTFLQFIWQSHRCIGDSSVQEVYVEYKVKMDAPAGRTKLALRLNENSDVLYCDGFGKSVAWSPLMYLTVEVPVPPPVPECVIDADCPTGYECVSGVCVKVTLPPPPTPGVPPPTPVPEGCVDDADCPSGYKCENGSCVSIAPPPTDPMTPLYVGVGAVVTGGILYYLIKRSGEKK